MAALGCTGSGTVTYSGEVQAPQLVEVSPGVQVIADADEPIFYTDNYYWRNDGGVWYRSRSHTTGWARVEVAPTPLQVIDQPQMYVHYHAGVRANLEARHQTPVVHERVVPESRHEERKDIREERKDAKEQRKDAKEERKDAKEERKEAKHERHEHD